MNEDDLVKNLAASFSGTSEEVLSATNILESFIKLNFPDTLIIKNLLISIIQNQKYGKAIRQSASIQIYRLIMKKRFSPDMIIPFCQELAIIIDSCQKELSPILKMCSNQLIFYYFYSENVDPSPIIFQLISQNHFKSSLFYANSYMKIISNPHQKTINLYKTFTSTYITLLHTLLISLCQTQNKNFQNEFKNEIISLIFHFLSRSTRWLYPEIFKDHSMLSFWMPNSMEALDAIQYDKYHYMLFLSNLPRQLFKVKTDQNFNLIINLIKEWTCSNIGKVNNDTKCTGMLINILYNLIKFDLFQFDQNFFVELLKNVILPNFNYKDLIEYNHPEQLNCWKIPHDASIFLFEEIINKNIIFLNTFYSLFQLADFIKSEFFIPALDLFSFHVKIFYEKNPQLFITFLCQLSSIVESSNIVAQAVFLKILSRLDDKKIVLPDEFLFKSACLSLCAIFNDYPFKYFAALASSSIINKIKNNENLVNAIYMKTPIIQRIGDLLQIFFKLEMDYQTEDIISSLKRIIFFFGSKIQPIIGEITNKILQFFFLFSSSSNNKEPSILLTSILCKLIQIAEGNIQYTTNLLQFLLSNQIWMKIDYIYLFDNLFEILTTLVYYSNCFIPDFCHIFEFICKFYLYNNQIKIKDFADVANLVDMLLWKRSKITVQNEGEQAIVNSIDSIIMKYLKSFIDSYKDFDEWIIAASLSVKLESFANNYEMSYILPKFLAFLNENENRCDQKYTYYLVEHMFSFHSKEIFAPNYLTAANCLFSQVFINNSRYPSFFYSFMRCFTSLPDEEYKVAALQAAIFLLETKNQDFEEEEEEDDRDKSLTPQWFDENEIMKQFALFANQLCQQVSDFPGKDKLLQLLSNL